MGAKIFVERVDDLGDAQVLGFVDRGVEGVPELLQHRLPLGPAAGDLVELGLQVGGEAILHVALKEAGQEGGDQAAPVFRQEAALF